MHCPEEEREQRGRQGNIEFVLTSPGSSCCENAQSIVTETACIAAGDPNLILARPTSTPTGGDTSILNGSILPTLFRESTNKNGSFFSSPPSGSLMPLLAITTTLNFDPRWKGSVSVKTR